VSRLAAKCSNTCLYMYNECILHVCSCSQVCCREQLAACVAVRVAVRVAVCCSVCCRGVAVCVVVYCSAHDVYIVHCVAACSSAFQFVAVCCSVCSVLHIVVPFGSPHMHSATCSMSCSIGCSVCCSLLHCMMHCVIACCNVHGIYMLQWVAVFCNVLQRDTVCCSVSHAVVTLHSPHVHCRARYAS